MNSTNSYICFATGQRTWTYLVLDLLGRNSALQLGKSDDPYSPTSRHFLLLGPDGHLPSTTQSWPSTIPCLFVEIPPPPWPPILRHRILQDSRVPSVLNLRSPFHETQPCFQLEYRLFVTAESPSLERLWTNSLTEVGSRCRMRYWTSRIVWRTKGSTRWRTSGSLL